MNDNVHGLLGAYAVDAVTADERAAFEAHLPSCEDCATELAGMYDVTAALADATAVAPPAALRARVFDQIARTAQLPPQADQAAADQAGAARARADAPRVDDAPVETTQAHDAESAPADDLAARRTRPAHRWPRIVLAAASVAVLAGAGAFGGVMLSQRNAEIAMEKDVMMVASAPDAHSMDLDLGTGHLVMSDRMSAVVAMGEDCPTPRDGMEYQLWVVMEDGSKHAGPTFMPEADGSFMTLMDGMSMDGVSGFAVTEEPSGGSDAPSGEMVAVVEL